MQVGLYLSEIAKGTSEQDVSTQFLSYRTDDIRPLIFNRWRDYLAKLPADDAVFGPWIEMKSWGSISSEDFSKQRDEYLGKLKSELDGTGSTADKQHALREEPPKWNPSIVGALLERKPSSLLEVADVYGNVFLEE